MRFSAKYRARRFPTGVVAPRGSLSFTADDLVHALFVTGRAPGDRTRFGQASFWEFLHRVALVPAYLRPNSGGRLVRSQLALELDRSEKVLLSYALGQAITGLFCEKLLSVTHLMHVDRYAGRYRVRFGATRVRPDLFGPSPDGWVVAEAKGRSNAMEAALPPKLEEQKRAIKSVEGQAPAVALGCVASFPPDAGVLRIDAVDPVEDEPQAIDLDVDLDSFLLAYYEPFFTAIDLAGTGQADDQETIASFPQVGLDIGLRNDVYERVRAATEGQGIDGLRHDIPALLQTPVGLDQGFPDGSVIRTAWDDALTAPDFEDG